tara:strand:- start:198 stop:332 length:135 start_codon:yes stop_codon:yes gene_type:complete
MATSPIKTSPDRTNKNLLRLMRPRSIAFVGGDLAEEAIRQSPTL